LKYLVCVIVIDLLLQMSCRQRLEARLFRLRLVAVACVPLGKGFDVCREFGQQ
jgi:hypothetical protein